MLQQSDRSTVLPQHCFFILLSVLAIVRAAFAASAAAMLFALLCDISDCKGGSDDNKY